LFCLLIGSLYYAWHVCLATSLKCNRQLRDLCTKTWCFYLQLHCSCQDLLGILTHHIWRFGYMLLYRWILVLCQPLGLQPQPHSYQMDHRLEQWLPKYFLFAIVNKLILSTSTRHWIGMCGLISLFKSNVNVLMRFQLLSWIHIALHLGLFIVVRDAKILYIVVENSMK